MLRSPLIEYESIHPLRSVHPADPDVAWLLAGDGGETHLCAAGDRLPIDIEASPGGNEGLRPLLALPVEVVLPAHEAPTNRAALERALLTADVHPVACASVFSPDQT